MSHETRTQKIFNCHSRPVTSICLHPSATVCASAQEGPNGRIIIWRLSDLSVLSVLTADLNDGVISVAFSSSGCSLACICSDPHHTIHVYSLPTISADSFDEENFTQKFGARVHRVWQWKSKALSVTGIYFDTGPREMPITFGRKHLRFWDVSKKPRENYQGGMYLLVGDDMGNGFQCCLVMQRPEVSARNDSVVTRFLSQPRVTVLVFYRSP
jgi:WD40 repeat protein